MTPPTWQEQVLRLPRSFNVNTDDPASIGSEYIARIPHLRAAGKLPIIFAVGGRYYVSNDPSDPNGTRITISAPRLRDMIERASQPDAPIVLPFESSPTINPTTGSMPRPKAVSARRPSYAPKHPDPAPVIIPQARRRPTQPTFNGVTVEQLQVRFPITTRQLQWWSDTALVVPQIVAHRRVYTEDQVRIIKLLFVVGGQPRNIFRQLKRWPGALDRNYLLFGYKTGKSPCLVGATDTKADVLKMAADSKFRVRLIENV